MILDGFTEMLANKTEIKKPNKQDKFKQRLINFYFLFGNLCEYSKYLIANAEFTGANRYYPPRLCSKF